MMKKPSTTRALPIALALVLSGCGLHSSVDIHKTQLQRDDRGQLQLDAQVSCYDSKSADSWSDWWNDEDDCTHLEVCWQVEWLSEAPEEHALPGSEWREPRVLDTTRGCTQTSWPNEESTAASIVIQRDDAVGSTEIAGAFLTLDAPVSASDAQYIRLAP